MRNQFTGNKGKFIVFEGIDGSGKTTQATLLARRMSAMGVKCFETREPTNGPIGSLLRQFLTGRIKTDDRALAALFAADRLDHLLNDVDGIAHKIESGTSVVCDRYYMSSYAYHGVSMPMEWVVSVNSLSAQILKPDCTVFIDVSPEAALERVSQNRYHTELYETLGMLKAVRAKYMEAIEMQSRNENILIISGENTEKRVAHDVWANLSKLFGSKGSQ